MASVRLHSPTAEANTTRIDRAPRMKSLRGAVVGLLDNGKPNAAPLLRAIGAKLKAMFGVRRLVIASKPPQAPASEATLRRLHDLTDIVITASAD